MDEPFKGTQSRRSVQRLAESIQSLLGFKRYLTSSWANSVCHIIKELPSEDPSSGFWISTPSFNTTDADKDLGYTATLSKIQDDLASLNVHLNQLNLQRRQALNDLLDLKGNIRVFCRIRPILSGEKCGYSKPIIASDSNNVILNFAENKRKIYSFDKVFQPGSSQDEVFSEVEPVIKSSLDGYNVCIFAYGQTGTGKTFTMEGKPDCPGVVPHAIETLFKQATDSNHTFVFTFSMLEIYMGSLRDLLVPQITKKTDPTMQCLSIQTDPKGGIEIDNLVSIRVNDFNQVKRLYRLGSRLRATASTNSNATSSRSHCLIRISMICSDAPERRRKTNKMWMVDLGGSERLLKTQAKGKRLEEGKAINLSLSALGDVISALQRKKSHVPYRNSKLTQVLKDSLGEDSKTLMLVHVSAKEEDFCETVCSLGFATRVRSIHLRQEESTDIRTDKEVAMSELLQQVKNLECARQDVRRDMQKLDEKLKQLGGTESLPDSHLEVLHLPNEKPQSNIEVKKSKVGNVMAASSSWVPRFMRPTVCSERKSSVDHQTSNSAKKKEPVPSKRRKPSSVRARSVSFPIKGNSKSEYSSDCSTSRASCLTDLNWKYREDNETQCSHDASECDIKMVVFPEQEKLSSSSACSNSTAHLSIESIKESKNKWKDKIDSKKHFTVDTWLRLQKKEPTNTYIHQSKRVLAVPNPEKKNKQKQQKHGTMVGFRVEASRCNASSPSDTVDSILCDVNSVSDQTDQTETSILNGNMINENSNVQDLCGSPQHMEVVEKPCLNSMKSRRALYFSAFDKENAAWEDSLVPIIKFQEKKQNTGICHVLGQTVQVLFVSALLGMGIQSIGLGHDFFHGLML